MPDAFTEIPGVSDGGEVVLSSPASSDPDVVEVDYSDAIDQIAQLLAYQDMMILVLTVAVVLFLGVFLGYLVTRWMRNR